jgi:epoxyqueuosine reductase
MTRKAKVWQAPQHVLEQLPELSGNTVNGLGEETRRRASPFFWHEAKHHEFGEMQRYTLGVMFGLDSAAEINEAFRINPDFNPEKPGDSNSPDQFLHRGPAPIEVAEQRVEKSANEWSSAVKEFALGHHADIVGIAKMQPEWVFEGFAVKEKFVIVLGVAHNYEEIAEAPSLPGNSRAIIEIGRQYTRGATAAAELSNFIRQQGYGSTLHPGPTAMSLLLIPAAIAAGLGELGKHGSLINRKLGSSFRLSAVTTDLPLEVDQPDIFGGDEFCLRCQVCLEACPPDAISNEKQLVRGDDKWYVDFDKCIPYFAESRGCGICIAVCPWSLPGVADRLVRKMSRRKEKRAKNAD